MVVCANQQRKGTGKMKTPINLIDSSFDKNQQSNYVLNVQVHEHSVNVCVYDHRKQIAVAIWSDDTKYSLLSENQSHELLSDVLDRCSVPLKEGYKSCSIAISGGQFSFVPNAIFDKRHLKEYIELNYGPLTEVDFKSEQVDQENLTIAYSIQKKIVSVLQDKFGDFKLLHHTNVFLNAITSDFKTDETELYANYSNKQLELAYFKKGKFQFGNSYEIGAAEDFIYYTLNTTEQLGLNPQKLKLILTGKIVTGDKIHHLAFSYFEKIQFGATQTNLKIASAIDELPKHYFYTIYKQHLCV